MPDNLPGIRPTVLVVDDEALSLDTVTRILDEDFEVRTAANTREAEKILEDDCVQVILSDQRMPEETGIEFLARVRDKWPDIVRIVISGYTDSDDIIEGINKAGIFQYITKPWHPENLLLVVRNACRLFQLQRENALLALEMKVTTPTLERRLEAQREHLKRSFHLANIVRTPESPLNNVCNEIRRIAPYSISALITGESGTGKELCARALHYNSLRADRPFVAENCGALPDDTLLESELFGHKKGAFTGAITDHVGLFEQADGGTIFLDEIGDISPAFQVKLLRVLQEGEIRPLGSQRRRRVDVRVIAATNRDLEEEIRKARFREDLYYRLAGVRLHLPPLRHRPMDIPAMAADLLEKAMIQHGKEVKGFTAEALVWMQRYAWPGNVRELQNEVQRMLITGENEWLGADLLGPRVLQGAVADEPAGIAPSGDTEGGLREQVERLEARILREALIRHRWNKSRAAEELGLSRVGLRNKLERYGLERKLDG